jgi:hypothetical protein
MDQFTPPNRRSLPANSVDADTFQKLSDTSAGIRRRAALEIWQAVTSRDVAVVASVAKHMDADALAKAVEDPSDHVSAVATAATRAVANKFAHFLGIDEQTADANPGDVCTALQETNERLAYLVPASTALAAGNRRPLCMHRGLRT